MKPELQNDQFDIVISRRQEAGLGVANMRAALEKMLMNAALETRETITSVPPEAPQEQFNLVDTTAAAKRLESYRMQADARNAVNNAHADFPLPPNQGDFDRAA